MPYADPEKKRARARAAIIRVVRRVREKNRRWRVPAVSACVGCSVFAVMQRLAGSRMIRVC